MTDSTDAEMRVGDMTLAELADFIDQEVYLLNQRISDFQFHRSSGETWQESRKSLPRIQRRA